MVDKQLLELKSLLAAIANLESNEQKVDYFIKNLDILQNYNLIFVDENLGYDYSINLKSIANLDYEFNSFFASNKLLIYNKDIILNALKGKKSKIRSRAYITFDLNIASEFKNILNHSNTDPQLHSIINVCKHGKCQFDIIPYIIENYMKNNQNRQLDQFAIDDIKAFETIFPYKTGPFTIPMNINKRMSTLKSYIESTQWKALSDDIYKGIYQIQLMYLLTVTYINLKYHKSSPSHKMDMFMKYCNNRIKAFQQTSNNLANLYFNNQDLRFFKKIQKNNPNLIKTIENMAWDLFHLVFLKKIMESSYEKKDIVVLPLFLTKDKGLNEIRQAYQVNCIFQNRITGQCDVFYNSIFNLKKYEKLYFTENKLKKRLLNNNLNPPEIIEELKSLILKEIKT